MADTNYILYGVLAGQQVIAASGNSTILGDLGSFLPVGGAGNVFVGGQTNIGSSIDQALQNAQTDYSSLFSISPNISDPSPDIGGATFNPGVIEFSNPGGITIGTIPGLNTINLDGNGVYIFQIPNGGLTTVTTTDPVFINYINGAKPTQIYWLVNGSVDLSATGPNNTEFGGTFLVQGDITLGTDSKNTGTLAAFNNTSDITLNSNKVISTAVQQPRDVTSPNYINIESTLADNQAVTISASNVFGGIDINAGFGGITIDTTNSLLLTAAAASRFVTSSGNLTLATIGPTGGVLDMDGYSGINIGNDTNSIPINIGSTGSKIINIGNLETGTHVSINGGGTGSNFTLASDGTGQDLTIALTGNNDSSIILTSQGTGADAIMLNTAPGGIVASANGTIGLFTGAVGSDITLNAGQAAINLVSNVSSPIAINIDNAGLGGISMQAGSFGLVQNALFGGTIGIGNFQASPILLGTVGDNVVTIGNHGTTTRMFERYGADGGLISTQAIETALTTDSTLSAPLIFHKIYTIISATPTTLTVDTIANFVTAITGLSDDDSIDFIIINTGAATSTIVGSSGPIIGSASVTTGTSGNFRIRFIPTSASYTIYRLS